MQAIYDSIGAGYDRHRRADPRISRQLAGLLGPPAPGRYLDLACGSGNYTAALASQGFAFCGLDQSLRMLTAARGKAAEVTWTLGEAERLPFADGVFAGVLCTLAIHHFTDRDAAFRECCRVLRPGATLVLFSGEAEQMRHYWLNAYFPLAMQRSIAEMPARAELEQAMRQAGFGKPAAMSYFVSKDLQDRFLYSGKHDPAFYLDAEARAAISTFAKHADEDELRRGLARLRRDIDTGAFAQVRRSFTSGLGDYLYLSACRL